MAGHSPGRRALETVVKNDGEKKNSAERQKEGDLVMKIIGEVAPSGSGKTALETNYVPVPMLSESECLKCSFITGKSD